MKADKDNIFLVDGNSLCYRAYYAIPSLTTSKGEPTNAVYGVVSMLKKIARDHRPTALAVAFDLPGETERHKKYSAYKENRPPMPDDLASQMDRIREVFIAYRIPVFEKQGYEADDIIATLTRKAREKGLDVTIVTGDKDAFQLVDEHVTVLSPHPSGEKIYDVEGVFSKFGVLPGQMTDLMALMGDSSDNIPGVKGIGKVTAGKLINEHGSLRGVYENLDKITSLSVRKKLEEGRDMAFLSRELVLLRTDLDLGKKSLPRSSEEPDIEALRGLYRDLEFSKLLKDTDPAQEEAPVVEMSVVSSPDDLINLRKKLETTPAVAFRMIPSEGYALSFPGGDVFYVALSGGKKNVKAALDLIKDAASSGKSVKVGHDIKKEMLVLSGMGIDLKEPYFDVMIADYLIDPSLSAYGLEDIVMRHFGESLSAESSGGGPVKGERVMDFAFAEDGRSASVMCSAAMRLYEPLARELKDKKLDELFFDIEMPLVRVLKDMEEAGVGVDIDYLRKEAESVYSEMQEVASQAYELAGEKFNMNSPRQVQEVLYGKLALPAGRKIKTGRSTDESALKKLSTLHELPGRILEYRHLSKLRTGYYDSILNFTDPGDRILHARFNQAVTSTGRLSSSEPNLQNIPVKTELGRRIRRAFRSREKGNVLIAADYSQVELRVLAHLSGDEGLGEAFTRGMDVHVFTASQIFGNELDDVTEDMRDAAKTVNFGVIYGMGSFGLAQGLGISRDEAESFIDAYFRRYSGVKEFIDATIQKARRDGYVTTLFRRRRYLPGITSCNDRVRSFAERAAVNTAVQGTAADIIKMAMVKCGRHFAGKTVAMTIQVHDELVFDAPAEGLKDTASEIKNIMENVVDLSVPLEVDVETGYNWRDLEPLDL